MFKTSTAVLVVIGSVKACDVDNNPTDGAEWSHIEVPTMEQCETMSSNINKGKKQAAYCIDIEGTEQ